MRASSLIAACALFGATAAANASPYLVTIQQVGSNVVATGSGNIDLTGLQNFQSGVGFVDVIDATHGLIDLSTTIGNGSIFNGTSREQEVSLLPAVPAVLS
jgi:hypothetical protein